MNFGKEAIARGSSFFMSELMKMEREVFIVSVVQTYIVVHLLLLPYLNISISVLVITFKFKGMY